MNEAHDALEDAKVQNDIVSSKYFADYINCNKCIHLIKDIFRRAEQQDMAKELEPTHPVHKPWHKIDLENNITWKPWSGDRYTGANNGGPDVGPTSGAEATGMRRLIHLWFFILNFSFFEYIAKCSHRYMSMRNGWSLRSAKTKMAIQQLVTFWLPCSLRRDRIHHTMLSAPSAVVHQGKTLQPRRTTKSPKERVESTHQSQNCVVSPPVS